MCKFSVIYNPREPFGNIMAIILHSIFKVYKQFYTFVEITVLPPLTTRNTSRGRITVFFEGVATRQGEFEPIPGAFIPEVLKYIDAEYFNIGTIRRDRDKAYGYEIYLIRGSSTKYITSKELARELIKIREGKVCE